MDSNNFKIQVVSKFMKSYETGSPIDYNKEIATAKDGSGNTIFFAIGTDNHLYAIYKSEGSETGWDRLDLSSEIGNDINVKHIYVANDGADSTVLTAVFYSTSNPNNQLVYFTKDFSPAAGKNRWVFRGNKDGLDITGITDGTDKKGNVVIAISTIQNNKMVNYLVNPNLNDATWLWKEVPVPLNGLGVVDFSIGHLKNIEKIDGVDALLYSLLDVGDNTKKLVITSLPDFSYFNRQVPLDFSPSCISTIKNSNGESILFVGEDSLYKIEPAQQLTSDSDDLKSNMLNIGTISKGHTIKKLINGRYSDGSLEAWILSDNGDVYLSSETSPNSWNSPYPIFKEIGELTCYRYILNDQIDMFSVDLNGNLNHVFQDKETTRWKTQGISVPNLGNTIEINSYTSEISITDSSNKPISNKEFVIKASELMVANINGLKYFIDNDTDTIVKTNALGQLTIINKVNSLSSPVIRLEADFLNNSIDLDPNIDMKDKITNLTLDDLKNAQKQTDDYSKTEPLISNPNIDITGVYQSVNKLLDLKNQLPPKPASNLTVSGNGVTLTEKGSTFTNKIDSISLPDDYTWAVDLTGESPSFSDDKDHVNNKFLNPATVCLAANSNSICQGSFIDTIGDVFGDIWESIKNGFLEVTHFIFQKVEDGIKIIIKGLEYAVETVIKFAEQVWDVIEYVFEKIGVFFEDLVDWLGFVFSWNDIKRTEKVFSFYVTDTINKLSDFAGNSAVDFVEKKIDDIISQVKTSFDNFEKTFDKNVSFNDYVNNGSSSASSDKNILAGNDIQNLYSDNKIQCNYVLSQIVNSGGVSISSSNSISSELDDFINNFTKLLPMDDLKTSFEKIKNWATSIENVHDLFNFGILTVVEVFKDTIMIVLDCIKDIVTFLLKLLSKGLDAFNEAISAAINIPIISNLFKEITGEDLSILHLVSFAFAIPATIMYKLIKNESPFTDYDVDNIINSKNSWPKLSTSSNFKNIIKKEALSFSPTMLDSNSVDSLSINSSPSSMDTTLAVFGALSYGASGLLNTYLDIIALTSTEEENPFSKFTSIICIANTALSLFMVGLSTPYKNWINPKSTTSTALISAQWVSYFLPIVTDTIALSLTNRKKVTRMIDIIGPGVSCIEGIIGLSFGIACAATCNEDDYYNNWKKAECIINQIPLCIKPILYCKETKDPEITIPAGIVLGAFDIICAVGSIVSCLEGSAS
ncbi:MAG: hypothetical protein Q8900_07665 [Bacillota bacterium]|nr:hypothetical protein [Bacillota bacterium]